MFEQYENLSSEDARRIVDEKLTEWKVAYAVRYVGETVKRDWGTDGKGKTVDAFRVTFGQWDTDFYMGIGNRKLPVAMRQYSKVRLLRAAHGWGSFDSYNEKSSYDRSMLELAKEKLNKPVNPSAADVLYCLLSDAEAADCSFSDWCDSFGADSDSIKAFRTYQACELTGQEMRRIFTRDQMAELRAILQNF